MMKSALMILLIAGLPLVGSSAWADDDWLVDVDEKTRAERLSSYLGGFSAAMWEVGERYSHMVQAISDDNFELASYHWDKIGSAIRGGYMKRPARQANADAIFLDDIWPKYLATLNSGDGENIRAQFPTARDACLACHIAEGVEFMNNQPLFTDLAPE